jgi:hypothetical protein
LISVLATRRTNAVVHSIHSIALARRIIRIHSTGSVRVDVRTPYNESTEKIVWLFVVFPMLVVTDLLQRNNAGNLLTLRS